MSQTQGLVKVLKKTLRQQGKTYKDVAEVLDLSEASVKRLFAEQSFSLQRFEQVCAIVGMDFSELVKEMDRQAHLVENLSYEQEKLLVGNIKLLLMAYCLVNHWTFAEVIEIYHIEELEGIQLLAQLDRIHIIQLLPGDRVKLMLSRNFTWLPRGPIQCFFEQNVQSDFFKSSFTQPGECRFFINGMLSKQSNRRIIEKIQQLAQEFDSLHHEDEGSPLSERHGTSLMLAMRPWEMAIFSQLRRKPDTKVF